MKRRRVTRADIADFSVLWAAWQHVSSGKDNSERRDVQAYARNLEENLRKLQRKLLDGTWKPDSGRNFWLFTEGKWRKIHTVGVETRLVNWAVVQAFDLKHLFSNRTFGAIKKRGTLKANKQVRRDMHRTKRRWAIKFDIHHYYPSISKQRFMDLVRHKCKGDGVEIMEMLILSYEPKSKYGLSIGATLSQDGGNFYLVPLDMYILSLGVRCYSRYVDDGVILCRTKQEAVEVIKEIRAFVATMGLTFSKIDLFSVDKRRIDFCGYALNYDNTKLRAGTLRRFSHKLTRFDAKGDEIPTDYKRQCIGSYMGFLKHCDSNKIVEHLINHHHEVFREINTDSLRDNRGDESAERSPSAPTPGSLGRVAQVLERANRDRDGKRYGRGRRRVRHRDPSHACRLRGCAE